jgi:hypothetical protein
MRMKHCDYGHIVETLFNKSRVTTVSHRYRDTTVVVAVPSTVHCPAYYEAKCIISGEISKCK